MSARFPSVFTYIWLVLHRKAADRRGKVQLIDGTRFFWKMKKSLKQQAQRAEQGAHCPPDHTR
jgi:type I restriction enzyme M protein